MAPDRHQEDDSSLVCKTFGRARRRIRKGANTEGCQAPLCRLALRMPPGRYVPSTTNTLGPSYRLPDRPRIDAKPASDLSLSHPQLVLAQTDCLRGDPLIDRRPPNLEQRHLHRHRSNGSISLRSAPPNAKSSNRHGGGSSRLGRSGTPLSTQMKTLTESVDTIQRDGTGHHKSRLLSILLAIFRPESRFPRSRPYSGRR